MGTPRKFDAWNAPPPGPVIDPENYIGKKPNKVIPVPYEYRRQTLTREGDILINDLKHEANCHVILRWDKPPAFKDRIIISFEVYGTGADVERGISQINRWISRAHIKSKDSSAWAKIPAYDPDDWYYDRIDNMEVERKLLFKGPMPLNGHPDAPTNFVSGRKLHIYRNYTEDSIRLSWTGRMRSLNIISILAIFSATSLNVWTHFACRMKSGSP